MENNIELAQALNNEITKIKSLIDVKIKSVVYALTKVKVCHTEESKKIHKAIDDLTIFRCYIKDRLDSLDTNVFGWKSIYTQAEEVLYADLLDDSTSKLEDLTLIRINFLYSLIESLEAESALYNIDNGGQIRQLIEEIDYLREGLLNLTEDNDIKIAD